MKFSTVPLTIEQYHRILRLQRLIFVMGLVCAGVNNGLVALAIWWGNLPGDVLQHVVLPAALVVGMFFQVFLGIVWLLIVEKAWTPLKDDASVFLDGRTWDVEAAGIFFRDHPEYRYYLDSVREQGRPLLAGEVASLYGTCRQRAQDANYARWNKTLYPTDKSFPGTNQP